MMKQESLFKKLGLILNELNEQYQFLAQNPQQLNELELELFHANANFLADHIQIIKKLNENKPPLALPATAQETTEIVQPKTNIEEQEKQYAIEPIVNEEIEVEETLQQVDFNAQDIKEEFLPEVKGVEQEIFKLDNEPSTFEFILNDHTENEKFDFEDKSVNEIFDRPLSPEEERILAQKQKLKEQAETEVKDIEEDDDEIGPEPFLVKKEESFVIKADDLEFTEATEPQISTTKELIEDPNYKPTLNDVLASNINSTSINTTNNKVTDLKQAINLNDKLLYIKDLFNGYNLAYAEAIELANKLPNFEAADNFFKKNYALKNNWNEKQATVDKFYKLLNERFK